jgi:hypothetical protein
VEQTTLCQGKTNSKKIEKSIRVVFLELRMILAKAPVFLRAEEESTIVVVANTIGDFKKGTFAEADSLPNVPKNTMQSIL